MNLQEMINASEIKFTLPQIKAFFLGSMLGKKPLGFSKAFDELFQEDKEQTNHLKNELQTLWTELEANKSKELSLLFKKDTHFSSFLESSKEQLDFFLTGLGLAGTTTDSAENDLLQEILEELEDLVLDIEDYLLSDQQSNEESQAIQEDLMTIWNELVKLKQ
jgi:hypothetical protein